MNGGDDDPRHGRFRRGARRADPRCSGRTRSSRIRGRSVAIRPGARQFTVTPSAATSLASVLAQPTRLSRIAFDTPRFGIGWTTPDDTTTMIRPWRRSRMPGRASRVRRTALRNMASNWAVQVASDVSVAGPGAGPPQLMIRISAWPSGPDRPAIDAALAISQTRVLNTPRAPWAASATAASRSALRAMARTCAPSLASACAVARPRPREAPVTTARRPSSPRFIQHRSDAVPCARTGTHRGLRPTPLGLGYTGSQPAGVVRRMLQNAPSAAVAARIASVTDPLLGQSAPGPLAPVVPVVAGAYSQSE